MHMNISSQVDATNLVNHFGADSEFATEGADGTLVRFSDLPGARATS